MLELIAIILLFVFFMQLDERFFNDKVPEFTAQDVEMFRKRLIAQWKKEEAK